VRGRCARSPPTEYGTYESFAGEVIWTPPGEWHWHGAAPDQVMVHTAIREGDEAECGELVTDEEYGYPA
jgi:quercetin dioxygenase-like cupin family protein